MAEIDGYIKESVPEYKDITVSMIQTAMNDMMGMWDGGGRVVRMYTGVGGADMFEEEVEFKLTGKRRVYIGMKVARFLRRGKGLIRKSHSGRYYKMYRP